MKKVYLFAATALAMASCTSDEYVGDNPSASAFGQSEISFGAGKLNVTRAEHTGKEAAELLGSNFVVEGVKGNGDYDGTLEQVEVFDHYNVNWAENTANTTQSNVADWEYVGQTKHALTTASAQTIKYWDYATKQHDFVAFSYGTSNATDLTLSEIKYANLGQAVTEADKAVYTITGTADDLAKSYVADLVTLYNRDNVSEYGTTVTPKFRSLGTKVRLAFYETVPGYAVSNVKFYTEAWDESTATATAGVATPTIFATSAIFPSTTSKGTMKVYYPTVGWANSANGTLSDDYNQAHVVFTAGTATGDALAKTKEFSALTYTAAKEGAEKCDNILGRTSSTATYAGDVTATDHAYQIVLPLGTSDNVQIRVEYDLYPTDGSEGIIHVRDARAVVPKQYCDWKPNYAYTYIFKISDNTNGWTGTDGDGNVVEGLTPITFDAVVVDSEDGIQETITTVSSPSITTYQEGINATVISEYKPGDVYITGMKNAAATASSTGITLYEATVNAGAPENTVISEATAELAYTQGGATAGTYDKTYVKLVQLTTGFEEVTKVPSADGNTMAINAVKLDAKGGKTYVARYEVDGKAAYKVIKIASEGVAGVAYNWQAAANAYTYTATVTATGGNEVTFTYAAGSVSASKVEILYDVARYLGAVYYAGKATGITFNSVDYTWDPTSAGNLKGSNWYGGGQTLVKAVNTWYAANPSATEITLKIDGTDTTLKFVQL